jgi:hypothetical protein
LGTGALFCHDYVNVADTRGLSDLPVYPGNLILLGSAHLDVDVADLAVEVGLLHRQHGSVLFKEIKVSWDTLACSIYHSSTPSAT